MTDVFYDTEFLENGSTIELISFGMVDETGREYYAVNADASPTIPNEWLMANVVPSLPIIDSHSRNLIHFDHSSTLVKSKQLIANEVREFLFGCDSPPELWADWAAYDHVVYAQLFGRMIDLPKGLPEWTHEFHQLWESLGRTRTSFA
jgi:hypothetical protein